MDKIIRWQGSTLCDLCGEKVFDKIYDTQVQTFQGITWANVCSACYNAYGISKAEPFIWNKSYYAFVKTKHVSDDVKIVVDSLGITEDEVLSIMEDFGL